VHRGQPQKGWSTRHDGDYALISPHVRPLLIAFLSLLSSVFYLPSSIFCLPSSDFYLPDLPLPQTIYSLSRTTGHFRDHLSTWSGPAYFGLIVFQSAEQFLRAERLSSPPYLGNCNSSKGLVIRSASTSSSSSPSLRLCLSYNCTSCTTAKVVT
jgi:hypothetical protein